jgi:hypothetical protein
VDTEAYQKALQRAEREGVRVIGMGTEEWFDNGVKCTVWFVSSGHPSADGAVEYYTVKLIDGEREMSCDCTAGQFRKVCKHRCVVHQLLSQSTQKQEAPKQMTRTQSVVRLVQFDGRKGRGSKCAQCGKAFVTGEWIALEGAQALHDKCVAQDQATTSGHPGDTAMMRRNTRAFSMMK